VWLGQEALPDIHGLYTANYFGSYYQQSRGIRRNFFDSWLRAWGRPPGRLLDVGCGIGIFLEAATAQGWVVAGVEPSDGAEPFRDRRFDVFRGTLESAPFAAHSFDLVTFWDVLAHLPDPLSSLRRARELLKPDGWLVVKTANRANLHLAIAKALSPLGGTRGWLHLPAQLYQFSPHSLGALVEHADFRVTEVIALDEPMRPRFADLLAKPKALAERVLQLLIRLNGLRESFVLTAIAQHGP
jgi:SAM-dependent methyltransferase